MGFQNLRLTYRVSDLELPDYCLPVLSMLAPVPRASLDVHSQVTWSVQVGGEEERRGA